MSPSGDEVYYIHWKDGLPAQEGGKLLVYEDWTLIRRGVLDTISAVMPSRLPEICHQHKLTGWKVI